MKTLYFLSLVFCILTAEAQNEQKYTLEAITNHGRFYYQLDNSGDFNVATDFQKILNEILFRFQD